VTHLRTSQLLLLLVLVMVVVMMMVTVVITLADVVSPRCVTAASRCLETKRQRKKWGGGSFKVKYPGLSWGLDFNPHTPNPRKKTRWNHQKIPIPTEPRNPPYPYPVSFR